MSVSWRMPGKLLPILAALLIMVSATVVVAQQEVVVDSAPSVAPAAVEPAATTPSPAPVAAPVTPVTEIPQPAIAAPVTAPAAAQAPVMSEEEKAKAVVAGSLAEANSNAGEASIAAQKQVKQAQGIGYYIDTSRMNVLVIITALLAFVTYFTFHAQRGKELFIRRISGLSALDDAVGRATEMGRGVLYVPGIMDMDDIQTIAGVTILGHVAKKTAEYDTPLFAPMTRSFVMSVAQEVVKQSYLEKGRPDAYRPDRINYLTDDQFGYVAGVGGTMMREKPAACFYLGTFYAESLILAETGNSVGAIQIAGTAEPSQIPFFVASCDYTLIGEELFAASAYLSKNPKEVGSLKGQDVSKIIIIVAILIGTVLQSIKGFDLGEPGMLSSWAESYMGLFK